MLSKEERIKLKSLLNRVASRKELITKHQIPQNFVYRSKKMPLPVISLSFYDDVNGMKLFDIEEVRWAYKRYGYKYKEWTVSEVREVVKLREEGLAWKVIAHRMGRTEGSVSRKWCDRGRGDRR